MVDFGEPRWFKGKMSHVIAGRRPVVVLRFGTYVPKQVAKISAQSHLLKVVPGTTTLGRSQAEATLEVDPEGRQDVRLHTKTVFLADQATVIDTCMLVRNEHRMLKASLACSAMMKWLS